MGNLSPEQAAELKAKIIKKRDKAWAEYNKCLGMLITLNLVDGTVDIIDDEEEAPDGEDE